MKHFFIIFLITYQHFYHCHILTVASLCLRHTCYVVSSKCDMTGNLGKWICWPDWTNEIKLIKRAKSDLGWLDWALLAMFASSCLGHIYVKMHVLYTPSQDCCITHADKFFKSTLKIAYNAMKKSHLVRIVVSRSSTSAYSEMCGQRKNIMTLDQFWRKTNWSSEGENFPNPRPGFTAFEAVSVNSSRSSVDCSARWSHMLTCRVDWFE